MTPAERRDLTVLRNVAMGAFQEDVQDRAGLTAIRRVTRQGWIDPDPFQPSRDQLTPTGERALKTLEQQYQTEVLGGKPPQYGGLRHGLSAYKTGRCKCGICRNAAREYNQSYAERKKAGE
jgi:hypothetical protein